MAESKSERGSFASDLHKLLESGEGADVTFVVGDSQLPAHSFVLAARSPVFAAMLRNDMQEATSRRIEVTDVREVVLRQVLSFLYTDTAPQLGSVAAELLTAADKYDLPLLKAQCERQLARDLSEDNAAETAALAVLHGCPQLRSAAVEFVAARPAVMASGGWERMLQQSPAAGAEICRQLAAAFTRPAPQPALATTVVMNVSTDPQSSEVRIIPLELKQKMGAKLIVAASNGRTGEVWALLTAGAPIDARDSAGNTALHMAASNGHAITVKCLLDRGLDVNAINSCKQTPLHLAILKGSTDIAWMLVAASAQVNAQDNEGRTPLHVAAQNQFTSRSSDSRYVQDVTGHVVTMLLLAGARQDIKDTKGNTPRRLVPPPHQSFEAKTAFDTYNSAYNENL